MIAICSVDVDEAKQWLMRQHALERSTFEIYEPLAFPDELLAFKEATKMEYLANSGTDAINASGLQHGCMYDITVYSSSGVVLVRCSNGDE